MKTSTHGCKQTIKFEIIYFISQLCARPKQFLLPIIKTKQLQKSHWCTWPIYF